MTNERKTEIIVRNHFNPFLDIIEIEEQKSDNPKINKLLKTALFNQVNKNQFIKTS